MTPATPAPSTATQVPFNFKATATPFTASQECPTDPFSPTDLDPEWAAACPHCLGATPTRTPGGFDFQTILPPELTQDAFIIPAISDLSLEATFTPVASATVAGTMTPTATATPSAMTLVDDWDSQMDMVYSYSNQGGGSITTVSGYLGNGRDSVGVYDGTWYTGGYRVAMQVDPTWTINKWYLYTKDVFPNVDLSAGWFYKKVGQSEVTGSFFEHNNANWLISGWNLGTQMRYSGPANTNLNQSGFEYVGFYRTTVGNSPANGSSQFDNFVVEAVLSPFTPTPVPSQTPTPTPSGTPAPTSTLDRSFRPQADCRVPVHVHNEPVADVDLNQMASSCYRLVPEVHLNNDVIVVVHIDVTPIDFCFDFYILNIKFLGLDIDIAFFVAVGLAFLAVRFGLFSG